MLSPMITRCPLDMFMVVACPCVGWRSEYVYHFCDRSQTLSNDISITKMIHNKNSSDLSWGTVPQSIAGEFLLWIILVIEISSLKV